MDKRMLLVVLALSGCGTESDALRDSADEAAPTAQQLRNPVINTWYQSAPTDGQIMLRNAKPGIAAEFQMITAETAPHWCIAGNAVVNPADRESGTITIGYFGAYSDGATGGSTLTARYTACQNAKASHEGTWNYEIDGERIRFWKDSIGTQNFAQLYKEAPYQCYGVACD